MKRNTRRHRTIKALVFDHVRRKEGIVDYNAMTEEILNQFPTSAWKRTHWAWYRYQILRGRFRDDFSKQVRQNLRRGAGAAVAAVRPMGPPPKDPDVKRLGDEILNHVRSVISRAADDDIDFRFKINRWVYARLLLDERRLKRPIKKRLWESGIKSCEACQQSFRSLKGVELHRRNSHLAYSIKNCELLCRECHQELQRAPT